MRIITTSNSFKKISDKLFPKALHTITEICKAESSFKNERLIEKELQDELKELESKYKSKLELFNRIDSAVKNASQKVRQLSDENLDSKERILERLGAE